MTSFALNHGWQAAWRALRPSFSASTPAPVVYAFKAGRSINWGPLSHCSTVWRRRPWTRLFQSFSLTRTNEAVPFTKTISVSRVVVAIKIRLYGIITLFSCISSYGDHHHSITRGLTTPASSFLTRKSKTGCNVSK